MYFFVSLFGFYFTYNFLYLSVLGTQEALAIWALKFNETNDWVVGDVVTNSINLGILIIRPLSTRPSFQGVNKTFLSCQQTMSC